MLPEFSVVKEFCESFMPLIWWWCSETFLLFRKDQPDTSEGALILEGKAGSDLPSPCFYCHFLVFFWLWRSSMTSEFLPELSRDHRVKNNLHFDNIRKAELHFSVTAALNSRTCCCFVITRKPQSLRLMTENPLGVSEILQYSSSPPLTRYTWLIDL